MEFILVVLHCRMHAARSIMPTTLVMTLKLVNIQCIYNVFFLITEFVMKNYFIWHLYM